MSGNSNLCVDHELGYEVHRRAIGESTSEDLPPLLDDWCESIFSGEEMVCDECEGELPLRLKFHCNREEQLLGFHPWPMLQYLLSEQLDRVREEPEDYEPEPVDGTPEERAAWYRAQLEIAFENVESDQQDWWFVLQVFVGKVEVSAVVRSRELMHGSAVVSLRPFTTLEAALQHRESIGTDDLDALTFEQLHSLSEEVADA
jgi:hypothetical protein